MHSFDQLIRHCAEYNLEALDATDEKIAQALQHSSATRLLRGLQMTSMARAVSVVGMFSMFDAALQDALTCNDGFREAAEILSGQNEHALLQRFSDLQLAINVLKHGRGRSYETLVGRAGELPFRIKLPGQDYFYEGDVSEISTLIQVDNAFVRYGIQVVSEVGAAIRRANPNAQI